MKKIYTSIYVLILLTGCQTLKDLSGVQEPSVRYSQVSVRDFSFEDVTLLFDFEVTNPNDFGVSADQYQYEFFINGSEFVTGVQNESLRIDKNSTSSLQVPVTLTFSEVFSSLQSVVRQDSMAYRLSTEVQFDVAGLGKQRVPVSAQGELPVPKLPRIEFNSFDVRELSFSGAEMEASFRIVNPNSFGLTFANIFYNLEVNGNEWLSTRMDRNINVGSSGSELISIPIRLSSSQMGPVLMDMLRGETNFQYQLDGSAEISADIREFTGTTTFPFNLIGTYRLE